MSRSVTLVTLLSNMSQPKIIAFLARNAIVISIRNPIRADPTPTHATLKTAMRRHDDAHLLDRAARALFAGAPSALFASSWGWRVAKSTVRSWRQGHRRPPLVVLKHLRQLVQERAAECNELWRDLGFEIDRRQYGPPPPRRGFMEIWERDGPGSVPRDGRNRLGRPRRK